MNELGKSPRSRRAASILQTIKQEPCFFDNSNSIESQETMDSDMESPIFFNTPYKIKDPIVLLERCDKIWETMQLIKTMQDCSEEKCTRSPPKPAYKGKQEAPEEMENTETSERYIRYQPVLNNGNEALPNFHFSVKRVKKLYHCNSCGKQYAENRSLRHHSYQVHGIFIPARFRRPPVKKGEEESKGDVDRNETKQGIHKKNFDEGIAKKAMLENAEEESNASTNSYESPSTKPYFKRNVTSICAVVMGEEGQKELGKKSPVAKQKQKLPDKCPLCRKSVKCVTSHIINYHKINKPELIIKELGQSFEFEDDKKFVKAEIKNEPMNGTSPGAEYPDVNSQHFRQHVAQKRKLSNSSISFPTTKRQKVNNFQADRQTASKPRRFDYKVQCKLCLHFYTPSSLEKHLLSHASKTENHADKQSDEKSAESPAEGNLLTEDLDESTEANPQRRLRRSGRITRLSSALEEGTTVCACGRTFRNPHHLFMHKRHCKVKDEAEPQRQNSSDRDSGIGISITIKKKNDSYEIVGKDSSGDENRSKDSEHSKDGDLSSDSSELIFENFNNVCANAKKQAEKYSKNHSVILVKSADEDVNVNVEDDTQLSSSSKSSDINDNLQDKFREIAAKNESIDDKESLEENTRDKDKKTRPERTSVSLQNAKLVKHNEGDKHSRKVPTLKYLCRKALANGVVVDKTKIHVCETCQKTFSDEKELSKHSVKCIRDTNDTCVCGKTFISTRSLYIHAKKAHPSLHVCPYCKESLRDINAYIDHHCNMVGPAGTSTLHEEINCPYCDEILNSSNKFDEHIKYQHFDPILAYQCYKCLKRFPNRPQRLLHFRKEHNVKAYVCSVCRKKITAGHVQIHESYHQGLGYPCHQCKKAYPSKMALHSHRASHSSARNNFVTCKLCKKSFKARNLRKHLNVHTKSNDCVICKRNFCSELKLEDHIMKNHSANYPRVRCNSCGMSFSTKSALQRHIQTEECYKYSKHTMEEEMLCDI